MGLVALRHVWSSQTRIEPMSPALAGRFLTPELPGKPQSLSFFPFPPTPSLLTSVAFSSFPLFFLLWLFQNPWMDEKSRRSNYAYWKIYLQSHYSLISLWLVLREIQPRDVFLPLASCCLLFNRTNYSLSVVGAFMDEGEVLKGYFFLMWFF